MAEPTSIETYEEMYTRLQTIVTRLETEAPPLEEALSLYEQGMQLAAACQRLLDAAELRIQQLQVEQASSEEG